MKNLSKIAILVSVDANLTFELDEVQQVFAKAGIESKLFYESESILKYKPDCVIVTSPQDGKLTPFPTYGLLNKPRKEYLGIPRFLRNVLTFEGYFTFSPIVKQMLGDVTFGARKLGNLIAPIDFFPAATVYQTPVLADDLSFAIFEPDYAKSKFKDVIDNLLDKFKNCIVVTFSIPPLEEKNSQRFILAKDIQDANSLLNAKGIVVCLESGSSEEKLITPTVIKAISASTVVIAQHTHFLESFFADNLFYLPTDTPLDAVSKVIAKHLLEIKNKPQEALRKAEKAHAIFLEKFAFDNFMPQLLEFHQQSLINKGYVPHPDPEVEKKLPSATYIIRTGGKHRHFLERTLDCMVAQQYPDLRVIFVIHAHFPYMEEIIANYPSLKIKVVESLKSIRSKAICDGLAAAETDLVGLYDDDDEMFPNHVRMLVKALQYHEKRDWRGEISMVYSGSLHVDDTFPVPERVEFQDHRLVNKNEKRAIEHFKFYSATMMSQHAWFMPNGWLARTKFIDDELLVDPELNTCEDLYFELQFAQRGSFAFSAEITTIHHFHHFGNSTIVDNHQHVPDTQRIALRNFNRTFAKDSQYDTVEHFRLVGKPGILEPQRIAYQDLKAAPLTIDYTNNAFYPFRGLNQGSQHIAQTYVPTMVSRFKFFSFLMKGIKYSIKFILLDNATKKVFFRKFRNNIKTLGYIATFKKVYIQLIIRNQISMNSSGGKSESFLARMFNPFKKIYRLIFRKRKMI